jgi:hypothetical protein
MTSRHIVCRAAGAAALMFAVTGPLQAGPPLICHPFTTGQAKLLPWDTASAGWNTPDRSYDVANLKADTLRLLSPDAPVLVRMENMRRAAIYAARDERVAADLLSAVLARAQSDAGKGVTPLAWFDAGYLIETYRQAGPALKRNMLPSNLDGYSMLKKALLLTNNNPEMEFAAALTQSGAVAAEHRRRAEAGATKESLLAANLASH